MTWGFAVVDKTDVNLIKSSLDALRQHAAQTPDRVALRGSTTTLSYAELNQQVEELAAMFAAADWKTVAVMLDNCPAWVVIDLAAARAGVTLVPLPAFFTNAQLMHSIADADVETLFTDQPERFSGFASHAQNCNNIAGTQLHCLRAPDSAKPQTSPVPTGTIKITYTSGTTGTPKGVCLNAAAMDSVALSLAQRSQVATDELHLCLLPLATLLENVGGIYVPLLAGATIALPSLKQVGMLGASGVNINALIAALEHYGATRAILLPQLLQGMVERLEACGLTLPQLRFLAVGGAPISKLLLQRAEALGLPLFQGYGLSECCSVVALNSAEHNRPGSVGQPLTHVCLRIDDDGEILVKGSLFSGYLGESTQTKTEWWPTGDQGYLDEAGYLFITGRKKNMFITSFGRNVAPEWVEQELVLSPSINQAFIYGEARPWNIAVLVTTATDTQVQAAVDAANRRLPDYAQVRYWLRAEAAFSIANDQLTATGRLRRESLWQAYGEGIEASYSESDNRKEKVS